MFWVYVLIAMVVLGFLWGTFAEYDRLYGITGADIVGGIVAGVCAAMAGGLLGLLGSVAVSGSNWAVTTSKPEVRSWNLVNMADGSTKTSGSFFLGTGNVNQTNMYTAYIDYGGRFQQLSIETYGVDIVFTDSTPVFSEYGHFETEDSFWTWFPDDNEWIVDRREFKVPNGSIRQDYTLDAQ